MATGRLPGTTNIQTLRWSKAPTAGTTTLSGADDNAVGLAYTPGYETVYLNGVLLVRGSDYTATDGTTVVLSTATVSGDIVNIFGTQVTTVTGMIPKTIVTAKGDLVAASSAGVPVNLAVGSNDQILVSDSTTATGLKWTDAPASGSMTLLSTTTLSSSGATLSSIPSTYTDLVLVIKELAVNASSDSNTVFLRFNGLSTSIYDGGWIVFPTLTSNIGGGTQLQISRPNSSSTNPVFLTGTITRYASSDSRKLFTSLGSTQGSSVITMSNGCVTLSSAISSITIGVNTTTITSGTVYLYGVN